MHLDDDQQHDDYDDNLQLQHNYDQHSGSRLHCRL